MQFYLDGYQPGDPFVAAPHPSVAERPDGLPEEVDVLIVGCGPAGLVLAATDPEKLRAAQEAAAKSAQPVRVPRERKPLPPPVDEPLIQVDTRQ